MSDETTEDETQSKSGNEEDKILNEDLSNEIEEDSILGPKSDENTDISDHNNSEN